MSHSVNLFCEATLGMSTAADKTRDAQRVGQQSEQTDAGASGANGAGDAVDMEAEGAQAISVLERGVVQSRKQGQPRRHRPL